MKPRAIVPGLLLVAVVATTASRPRAEDAIVVRPVGGLAAPVTEGRVDHSAYDALLRRYVDDRGLVDYAAWKAADVPALERYLASMAAVRPDELADRDERLAYWINVYNALTLHGMLHFYPTKSIKDHVSRLWGFHFWKDVRIDVAGEERSLDAIEHEILRKMGEPRIHFAIVCAALGCPKLRNEAYTGTRLETRLPTAARGGERDERDERGENGEAHEEGAPRGQLDAQAFEFFGDPSKFAIDRKRGTVKFSSILDWFGEDFGGADRAKLDFAARYVRSEEERAFLARSDLDVAYLDYDWGINDRPHGP
jgi:hypothetical protein